MSNIKHYLITVLCEAVASSFPCVQKPAGGLAFNCV